MAAIGMPVTALTRSEADISDEGQVAEAITAAKPAIVVNAAAYTNVDGAETRLEAAMRPNAIGPAVLAAQCAAAELPIIHFSTDYVFDGRAAMICYI